MRWLRINQFVHFAIARVTRLPGRAKPAGARVNLADASVSGPRFPVPDVSLLFNLMMIKRRALNG
ncbi:MAG: hypothetical protein CM15mP74_05640 [Halieaceae bacterium]|nr:MAG: hypothetical protein CM15mP74_05640 [Halieaceae bacterium]